MRGGRAELAGGGEPASVPGADVSHNLFALFGVEPILGRTFLAEEEQEGNDRVVILSESLWRSRFNADPSLVGKSILLDGQKSPGRRHRSGVVPASLRRRARTCGSKSFALSCSARRSGAADGQFQLRRCRPREARRHRRAGARGDQRRPGALPAAAGVRWT